MTAQGALPGNVAAVAIITSSYDKVDTKAGAFRQWVPNWTAPG